MKFIYYTCFILLLVSCGPPKENSFVRLDHEQIKIPANKNLYIKSSFQEDVSFQGLFNYDDAELDSGNIAYPGNTAGLFLVSIATHAFAADSLKDSKKTKIRERANAVLIPYTEHIQGFNNDKLVSSYINSLDENYDFQISKYADGIALSALVLKSEPVFFMTQDQRKLILKHAITYYHNNEPEIILYRNIVEVASVNIESDDKVAFWAEDNKLILVSGELYAKSIELFIDDMLGKYEAKNIQQKTYRYLREGKNNYERGVLLKKDCGRAVIRTLRGWLKSFYPNNIDSKDNCIS